MFKSDNQQLPVVLVDDEVKILYSARIQLIQAGFKAVQVFSDSREVLPFLEKFSVGVLVLDLIMPHLSGQEVLEKVVQHHPDVPVIIMTASQEIEYAIDCLKIGATDYLLKPVEPSRFVSAVRQAIQVRQLQQEVHTLKNSLLSGELSHESAFRSFVTCNRKMHAIFQYLESIARTDRPILITGEAGVGKTTVGKVIHELSGVEGPFVVKNVAGLDEQSFTDLLFGHRRGAFEGADKTAKGVIAEAAGGTLFLEEVGDLPPASQIRLLRLLQEKRYYPLGSDTPFALDARIVVATHRDLNVMMEKEIFRLDLFYRLASHQIHVPALRERKDDIPLLIMHFIERYAQQLEKEPPTPPSDLFSLLTDYAFPGNVHELSSMVYDAVVQHQEGTLSLQSFRQAMEKKQTTQGGARSLTSGGASFDFSILSQNGMFPTLKEIEYHAIQEALERSKGNQTVAASLLGISRQTLYRRLSKK
ncbi:sigma-54-dependent transcriptional regulator [Magnetococcales bacterium HHB-1]